MTMIEMAIRSACYHLKRGPITCSTLGVQLWGKGMRKPQSYARPAGRILHEMKRRGLVRDYFDHFHQHFMWELVADWKNKVRDS